jgi:hypothetical protein
MTFKKTSLEVVCALFSIKIGSAVKLDSIQSPCAEQALAQMEEAAEQRNDHCLCF